MSAVWVVSAVCIVRDVRDVCAVLCVLCVCCVRPSPTALRWSDNRLSNIPESHTTSNGGGGQLCVSADGSSSIVSLDHARHL